MNITSPLVVGDIWTIGVLRTPAVIVCVHDEPASAIGAIDVRVVPLSMGARAVFLATDHDVLVDADDITDFAEPRFWGGAVAHAWLAEPVRRTELGARIGALSSAKLRVVQEVELLGLGPVPEDVHAASRGAHDFALASGEVAEQVARVLQDWRDNLAITHEMALATASESAAFQSWLGLSRYYRQEFVPSQGYVGAHSMPGLPDMDDSLAAAA